MTEFERQVKHAQARLAALAAVPGGADTPLTLFERPITRAELARLFHRVIYERAWCARQEARR